MNIKLMIAGLKWLCIMPKAIFNESLLSFASDFTDQEDIYLEIKFTDRIDSPTGQSITNEILEWHLNQEGLYPYHLIKRDEQDDQILVSLKANASWSNIFIEVKNDHAVLIEFINILLLEIVFRNRLLFHDGLVIHASAITSDGGALAFTAPSGTGKSTHVKLWQENYPVHVINDDHPAVRVIDGKIIVFGTPWAGETKKFSTGSSVLEGVVILEQGNTNQIWQVNNQEVLREFLPRCFLPYFNQELLEKALRTFTEITTKLQIYKLSCKPDQEAVRLSCNQVWPNKFKNGMVTCE